MTLLIHKKIWRNQTKPSAVWQTQQASDSHWRSSFHKKVLSMWSPSQNHSEIKWLAMCRGALGLPEWVPQTDCDWQKSVGRERNSGTASPEAQKNRQHADFEFHRGSRKKTAALTRDLNSDSLSCHHSESKTQLAKKFRMRSIGMARDKKPKGERRIRRNLTRARAKQETCIVCHHFWARSTSWVQKMPLINYSHFKIFMDATPQEHCGGTNRWKAFVKWPEIAEAEARYL